MARGTLTGSSREKRRGEIYSVVRAGLRDIAGWLNETACEKLTRKRCKSASLAESRCLDAYTRSILPLFLALYSFVLLIFRAVHTAQ